MGKNKDRNAVDPPTGKGRQYLVIFLALAVPTLALWLARWRFIRVVSLKNGEFLLSRYPLQEEAWDHPRLKLLRQREHLDQVVAPGKTQFEKIVLLRKWAHDQWKESDRFYYPPWDAVEILDLAHRRGNYGFCAQYAIVFLQACRSLGLHARYVDLGHFITGIWSDEYNKWVIMDPNNDWHYERGGVPMSGMALNKASWQGKLDGIYKVSSDGSKVPITKVELDLFRNYSIILRNNQLSVPETLMVNGKVMTLSHQDDYTRYPVLGRDVIGYGDSFLAWHPDGVKSPGTDKRLTDDKDDFKDVYNQTIIFVAAADIERKLVKLKLLAEQVPDFRVFQIKMPSSPDWTDSVSDEVIWHLSPGMNALSARVSTIHGWTGRSSTVKVYYKARWVQF